MFDSVREVCVLTIDAGTLERTVEQFPRRADERASRLVLDVAGCFADDEECGLRRAFAENGLRGASVKAAASALFRRRA